MPLKIQRGQSPLQNISNDDVPITVVPDNQMPKYGEEVPVRDTNQALDSLLGMIRAHQKPVTIPFAAGTPTEQKRQFDTGQEFSREQWDWQKDLTERQFAADQNYKNAQLALSQLRAGGSGGSLGSEGEEGGAAFEQKRWDDAVKIVRERWDANRFQEDDLGNVIETKVPFDSLPEYERYKLIAEVYYTGGDLPTGYGFDPSVPPSTLPDMGSADYFRSLADQAKQSGYADSDISQWLVNQHQMPVTMLTQLGLPPIDRWQVSSPSQYKRGR